MFKLAFKFSSKFSFKTLKIPDVTERLRATEEWSWVSFHRFFLTCVTVILRLTSFEKSEEKYLKILWEFKMSQTDSRGTLKRGQGSRVSFHRFLFVAWFTILLRSRAWGKYQWKLGWVIIWIFLAQWTDDVFLCKC